MHWMILSATGFMMFAGSLIMIGVPVVFTSREQRRLYVELLGTMNILGLLITFYAAIAAMVDP